MVEGCPGCGAIGTVTAEQVDEQFQYGAGPDAVMLTSHHCLLTCSSCTLQYTSSDAEESRQRAVDRHVGDVRMLAFLKQFKPCPFCGYKLERNLNDSFHPSGSWWRDSPDHAFRHYVSHRDRQEGDHPVYILNCPQVSGGCGAQILADTPEQALGKWNRRA